MQLFGWYYLEIDTWEGRRRVVANPVISRVDEDTYRLFARAGTCRYIYEGRIVEDCCGRIVLETDRGRRITIEPLKPPFST